MKNGKIMKIVIIVLSILLASSIIALGTTLIYNHFNKNKPYKVTIPDHVLNTSGEDNETEEDAEAAPDVNDSEGGVTDTENEDDKANDDQTSDSEDLPVKEEEDSVPSLNQGGEAATDPSVSVEPDSTTGDENASDAETEAPDESTGSDVTEGTEEEKEPTALALQLHNKNPDDNIPFKVSNMFPGDSITQYYCVKVSYTDVITMRFRADTRPGYEKLSEALKCKVVLMNTGKTLYNGTFKNMPEAISYQLPESGETTTAELYYKITVYLETSVGNEYMNKSLIADFRWWVEETGNLKPPAQSGDGFNTFLWGGTAIAAAVVLVILKKKRRTL